MGSSLTVNKEVIIRDVLANWDSGTSVVSKVEDPSLNAQPAMQLAQMKEVDDITQRTT